MWVFTEFGFFSIVAHRTKPDTVIVRGRVKDDVLEFEKRAAIRGARAFEDFAADYPFRLEIPKAAAAKVLLDAIVSMNYDNFKNQVARRQGWNRSIVYHEVWSHLAGNL